MQEFLTERHLATLTTVREDGTPHVVPVGFSYDADAGVVRVITWAAAQKARNAERMSESGTQAAVCQVDGARWLTLQGPVRLVTDAVEPGVRGYAERYREPKERDDRVVIEITVERVMSSRNLRGD